MSHPTPYLLLTGTARVALTRYAEIFGGGVQLHTFAEFQRTDGPAEAVAHGYLTDGPVELFAADVAGDEQPFRCAGLLMSLLGATDAETAHRWFADLSVGGQVVDALQRRPWGACDGKVVDQFGVPWLIGYELDGA